MTFVDLPENIWKERFAAKLAALFIVQGLNKEAAIADAAAHADDCFPSKGKRAPEDEAQEVFATLKAEAGWE